jgi:hypothetical protein
MNILFYGNCQCACLYSIFNLQPPLNSKIIMVHTSYDMSKDDFDILISNYDIIITQPISDNYKDKYYLSTKYLIENKKPNTKIIIFPSLHFDFYYSDLQYITIKDTLVDKPSPYHYKYMRDYISNNKTADNYINEIVNNKELIKKEDLLIKANSSIEELIRRENDVISKYNKINNVYIIKASEFIKNNFLKKLLFYSMNHPTKFMFHFIIYEIIKIVKFDEHILKHINYNIDPLNHDRCIIYDCMKSVCNFDIHENGFMLNNNINNTVDIYNEYVKYYNENEHERDN